MDDCYGFMCNLFSSLFALFIVGALVILAWKFLEFHVFGGKEDFSRISCPSIPLGESPRSSSLRLRGETKYQFVVLDLSATPVIEPVESGGITSSVQAGPVQHRAARSSRPWVRS